MKKAQRFEWLCKCGKWYNDRTIKSKPVQNLGAFILSDSFCPHCGRSHKEAITGRDLKENKEWEINQNEN